MRFYLIRGGIILAALFIFCGKSNAQVIELACPAGTTSVQSLQTIDQANSQLRQNYCVDFNGNVFQNITGNISGNINGNCQVTAIKTLQQCINAFPGGNVEIDLGPGVFSYTAAISSAVNGLNGIKIKGAGRDSTLIKYTGSTPITAIFDFSPATVDGSQQINHWAISDLTLVGNANVTNCIRLRSLHTTTIQDVACRDVTGFGLAWFFGTGNVINHWSTSPDGVGFNVTPTGCIQLDELDNGVTDFGFSTSTIITPRCEHVSGTAVTLKVGQMNAFSGCQISTNGAALDIEPGNHASTSSQNSFQSCLLEQSSNTDGVIVNGFQNFFYNNSVSTNPGSTGKLHIKAGNNRIEGGQIVGGGITVDSGVLNTHFTQVNADKTKFVDSGSSTMLTNNFDPTSGKQWFGASPTLRQVIPATPALNGGAGFDPMDHPVQSVWSFTTSLSTISTTPLTTGKPWRALLIGMWENNSDGAGLTQAPTITEITSVANTFVMPNATITFSVSAGGLFQAQITAGAATAADFSGTIYIIPNISGSAGTSSFATKNTISAGSGGVTAFTSTTGAGLGIDFKANNGNVYRTGNAGDNYFLDVGNVLFRDGSGAAGGAVTMTGGFLSSGTGPTLTGTGACATFGTKVGGAFAGSSSCTAVTAASTLTITFAKAAANGYICNVQDETTRANLFQQTSHTTTTCVLTATSVTQNDVFVFSGIGF